MKMNQFLKLTEIEIKPFTLMRKIVTIKSDQFEIVLKQQ